MSRGAGVYVLLGLLAAAGLLALLFSTGGGDVGLDRRAGRSGSHAAETVTFPAPPPARGTTAAPPADGGAPTAPPGEAKPETAHLSGRIVDPAGKPVPGAEFYVADRADVAVLRPTLLIDATADEHGAFSLHPPPGVYDFVAWHPGYRPTVVADVVARAGAEVDLGTITLPAGKAISGRVLDTDGRAVRGADVVAYQDESMAASPLLPGPGGVDAWGGRILTDDRGEFRVAGLGNGTYHLRAEGVGIVMVGKPVEAVAGAVNVGIVVRRVRVATGLVLSEDGEKPVVGATVTLTVRAPAWSGNLIIQTRDDGRFVVDLSDSRFSADGIRFDVQISADGYEDASREDLALADVLPEGALVIRLVAAPPQDPGTLRGHVVYDTGEPFALGGLTLSFSRRGRSAQVFRVQTDKDGGFVATGITPGEYLLRTAPRDGRTLIDTGQHLVIPPGGVETAELTLPRGGDLGITVVDSRGDPVKDAQITVLDGEGKSLGAFIVPTGAWTVYDLPPGPVTVRATAAGYTSATAVATAVKDRSTPLRLTLDRK